MTVELTAPIVEKDVKKRVVIGPVLIPDEKDSDGDVVKAEKIEEVAHRFAEEYGNIDVMHTLENVGKMVETYLTPVELTFGEVVVPKGSWMLGVRVTDDATWKKVEKGEISGFSIMGIPKAEKSAGAASKRTTLADFEDAGKDWEVNAVSLVDRPAVPKAKFVAIKAESEEIDDSILQKFMAAIGLAAKDEKGGGDGGNEKGEKKGEDGDDKLTKDDVKSIVRETIKEILGELKQGKGDKGAGKNDPIDPAAGDPASDPDVNEKVKQLEKTVKELEAASKERGGLTFTRSVAPLFKTVAGQDGMGDGEDDSVVKDDRDPFGFKVMKKGEER